MIAIWFPLFHLQVLNIRPVPDKFQIHIVQSINPRVERKTWQKRSIVPIYTTWYNIIYSKLSPKTELVDQLEMMMKNISPILKICSTFTIKEEQL